MIHKQRYLRVARSRFPSSECCCLCYAMWAIAACLSSQYRQIRHDLCLRARSSLENLALEERDANIPCLEEAQAWILISIFESMEALQYRACMSAARAIRLVQLAGFHRLDNHKIYSADSLMDGVNWAEIEEKRRTFWITFCLDRLRSIDNDCPLLIGEQTVRLLQFDSVMQNVTTMLTVSRSAHCFPRVMWPSRIVKEKAVYFYLRR
jgi:hypothetical protein